MRFDRAVVDASVALKWVLDEDLSDVAEGLLDRSLIAPDFWLLECGNVLWVRARRGELSPSEAEIRRSELLRAPVTLVPTAEVSAVAFQLAFALEERIYDCAYLALAVQKGLPLITADQRFVARIQNDPKLAPYVISLAKLA